MLAWVVIDRTHSRQTSPYFSPRSYSHFGSHPSLISEKISPFFSCTYVDPILQPVCFQIHACNGGCGLNFFSAIYYPLPTTHYPPWFHTLAHSFALFCTSQKLNSFIFKRFRTLRQKTQPPRVGVGVSS